MTQDASIDRTFLDVLCESSNWISLSLKLTIGPFGTFHNQHLPLVCCPKLGVTSIPRPHLLRHLLSHLLLMCHVVFRVPGVLGPHLLRHLLSHLVLMCHAVFLVTDVLGPHFLTPHSPVLSINDVLSPHQRLITNLEFFVFLVFRLHHGRPADYSCWSIDDVAPLPSQSLHGNRTATFVSRTRRRRSCRTAA